VLFALSGDQTTPDWPQRPPPLVHDAAERVIHPEEDHERHGRTQAARLRTAPGMLRLGEEGAPFRRSTFGRKRRKARKKVGMADNFRFYDLRHAGNTLAADTGAKLKDLMVRAGQSSERAQLIYQHSTVKHQRKLAQGIDAEVRQQLRESGAGRQQTREA
jgi:integrase